MGMSTHAVGFRPPDEEWRRMVEVWKACNAAGCDVPEKVMEFFQEEEPGDKPGMEVSLGESCYPWSSQCSEGYEIDIKKLPDGVRYIRIYNSY